MEENRQPHSPLAGGCIRLLTLFPGSFCSPIEGQLTDVTLTAGCAYEALSYVWGDKGDPLMMNVNKKPFYITKNLECALRHLRYTEDLRILWVDAICINQQDDDEKSKQVAMMGRIYNEDQKVYAWLGEGNRQSCQPGTSVHRVHVNCISHVTLRHLLTHLGCVYNRSM
jgi:hypothetical protein